MLERLLPKFEDGLAELSETGTAGFTLAFNVSMLGPEHLHSTFPQGWQDEYQERNYFAGDPIFLWAAGKQGFKRWSEIRLPDLRGIMGRASSHGLKYGLVCSLKTGGKRSFMTVARPDRELQDAEIGLVCARFGGWCKALYPGAR